VCALAARGLDPSWIVGDRLKTKALATGRRLAISTVWRLRRLVGAWQVDAVHAWTSPAYRTAQLALFGARGVRLVANHQADLRVGIDSDKLRREVADGPSRERLLTELGLPPKAKLLGTAGRLTRAKQVTELLWALDQIRCVRDDVYLLVIGDGEARPLYERYARLYEIADRVRFLGWRSDAAVLAAQLDVYCSASILPSCSLAVLEAIALGVPVIASDTIAHRQLVAHGETGFLVDVRQRSEMARWCLRVLEDSELAARMREAAQRRAVEHFAPAAFVAQIRHLYDDRV
jgi:glycosyltransferase involved in cell wall biosynthesis